jgi:hypothetical protein
MDPRGAAHARTRLFGIVARDAPVAVVFRRGPTRHVRMARWDLRTDVLTYGQWLVGRLYPEASGLSPDGRLLVYYARKGPRTFTAMSQPPYFTALAFWENTSPWTAGGFFQDNRRLVLGVKYENPRDAGEIPDDFEVTDVWEYFWKDRQFTSWSEVVPQAPEANHGFRASKSGRYEKPNPSHPGLLLIREPGRHGSFAYQLEGARGLEVTQVDWADWAPDGALLVGKLGCLYRHRLSRGGSLEANPALVADLREQAFERILPPEDASHWPSPVRRRGRSR